MAMHREKIPHPTAAVNPEPTTVPTLSSPQTTLFSHSLELLRLDSARLERSCALRASEVPEIMLHSRSNQHISSTNMREMRAQRATGTR